MKCEYCGNEFEISAPDGQLAAHTARRRFCSAKCQSYHWRENNPKEYKFSRWKAVAKNKGIPFDIELSDLEFPDKCPLLGIKLTYYGVNGRKGSAASLDRIVPELGYKKGNVMVMSSKANSMKNDATISELIEFSKNVLATFGDES